MKIVLNSWVGYGKLGVCDQNVNWTGEFHLKFRAKTTKTRDGPWKVIKPSKIRYLS